MVIIEKNMNIFDVPDVYYRAHCVDATYALGINIAKQFDLKYDLKSRLIKIGIGKCPDCILIDNIFNLVTKKRHWDKPTYPTLANSLLLMKTIAIENNIHHITMPMIGCGADKLEWEFVRFLIAKIFSEVNIEILIADTRL